MKIGDKVVCIDDSPCRICGFPQPIIKNTVYVIEEIDQTENGIGVNLIGNHAPACHGYNSEIHFYWLYRFRLLDELKAETRERQSNATAARL